MGGACTFTVLVAYSLIADGISRDNLALLNLLFGSCVYLGGALTSLSLLLDGGLGWRGTLTAIGGCGAVVIATAGLLLPSNGDRDGKNEHEVKEGLALPNSMKQIYVFEYAVINAFITGAVGMSSGILGGYIADSLGARGFNVINLPVALRRGGIGSPSGHSHHRIGRMLDSPSTGPLLRMMATATLVAPFHSAVACGARDLPPHQDQAGHGNDRNSDGKRADVHQGGDGGSGRRIGRGCSDERHVGNPLPPSYMDIAELVKRVEEQIRTCPVDPLIDTNITMEMASSLCFHGIELP
ncbi:hypothetical protein ACHAW5_010297 [Stephanodiscus triporus]|uniref:Major facilitator superfamily (MFS) profile domain-containing protein n=1 Tax=Stephanodiscus triporus TaxID=2934178 RepID=A0ABD3N4T3_9STRA